MIGRSAGLLYQRRASFGVSLSRGSVRPGRQAMCSITFYHRRSRDGGDADGDANYKRRCDGNDFIMAEGTSE